MNIPIHTSRFDGNRVQNKLLTCALMVGLLGTRVHKSALERGGINHRAERFLENFPFRYETIIGTPSRWHFFVGCLHVLVSTCYPELKSAIGGMLNRQSVELSFLDYTAKNRM